ncbi:transglutaminase-like cysteine peptidase [Jiella avicenniae]|uniref:Transglutaminase-like cysteine peptidase n=1 Tax=Jiella avicenniae TaxID=2907202 RepID=A0A9X1T6P9_9HYPH|nr:transglutaminase-like cysteine peptidase [Jiella avicenniae]MCE7030866.1 transglutaminase-like cysteine peptidase [Jiella avicenniae]
MKLTKKFGALIAAMSIAAAVVQPAEAGGLAGFNRQSLTTAKRMQEGRNVMAPFAFIRFCTASPADCRVSREQTVAWSGSVNALIARTNWQVNSRIRPTNERSDTWRADVSSGDCEDFALTKRRHLIKAGLPSSALRIAVAKTPSGEGHAVLVVKTTRGDFVLDNRTNSVKLWQRTDLRWEKIASAENPYIWRKIV